VSIRPPDDGLPPPSEVGMRARPTRGWSRGTDCVVVVKHVMPDGSRLLGWEFVSDLGSAVAP
jgi:hypothetical protein